MAETEEPTPRLVQSPGDKVNLDDVKTQAAPSSDKQFEARPHDGIWSPEHQASTLGEPASREAQVKAFGEYVQRTDIESRESILARETALPGQFSNANVKSGSVDDGLVGHPDGSVEENKAAKKEASSIKGVTAADKGPAK